MTGPLFHVVLVEPEIPNNTGAIGRTCIVTGCALHLVHPLGFDTSEKALRRAGLDYWARVDVRHHESWKAFLAKEQPQRLRLTSGKRGRAVWEAELGRGDYLIFGKETAGLDEAILEAHADRIITLPMLAGERGLNLANVATAVVYEGVRQCVGRGELGVGADGRLR